MGQGNAVGYVDRTISAGLALTSNASATFINQPSNLGEGQTDAKKYLRDCTINNLNEEIKQKERENYDYEGNNREY